MGTLHRVTCTLIGLGTVVLAACAKTDNNAASDTSAMKPAAAAGSTATGTPGAAPSAAAPAAGAPISLSSLAGKWTSRSVPDSGKDTSVTTSMMTATSSTSGWTLTFPGRQPIPLRVSTSGDSLMTDAGPYESVRRKGMQVTIHEVMHMQGDSLVGTTIAHYKTNGADSLLTLHTTSKRMK
jgi:hypothetical protein